MLYCEETVIVQGAFMLADKLTNLKEGKKKTLLPYVQIITGAINEVSEGLCLENTAKRPLPIETRALHCKLHLWLHKTWLLNYEWEDMDGSILDGFPLLPKFGVELYILIVQEMAWENLFIECLTSLPPNALPCLLHDVILTMSVEPCTKDTALFTKLFTSIMVLSSSGNTSIDTSVDALLNVLASSAKARGNRENISSSDESLSGVQHKSVFTLSPATNVESLNLKEIQQLHERLQQSINENTREQTSKDEVILPPFNNITIALEVLYGLLTDHWKDTSHWIVVENDAGSLDCSLWHPLHQWLLKLYPALGVVIDKGTITNNVRQLYDGLDKYVNMFACTSEREHITKQLAGLTGLTVDHIEADKQQEDIEWSGLKHNLMFASSSILDQLDNAIWRIDQTLEGFEECFDWLLTTEELFDNPKWLECIKNNVIKIASKDQAIMMVDILCVQRQIIGCVETEDDSDIDVFSDIKELLLAVFNNLTPTDQEELIEYTFSVSFVSGIDISVDSILFHPINGEENKCALQEELQVVFNKIVDSSLVAAFSRAVKDIKRMALVSPYTTLHRAIQAGVQYGHVNTIIKILEEVPSLCTLSTSDTNPAIVYEIVLSITKGIKAKQEEKNLIKLISLMLQPHKQAGLPCMSEPLLNITDFVKSCVLPHLTLDDSGSPIPTTLALKLLKSSLTAFDCKQQRAFVLRYLIPIVLTLCRLLDGCKVTWDGMSPDLQSLSVVAELRSLVLDTLRVSIQVIRSVSQGEFPGLTGSIQWLNSKMSSLDWTMALYIQPLLDLLPTQHQYSIPDCLIKFCDLPTERWTPNQISDYDVVLGLFECCAVLDSTLHEVVEALKKTQLSGVNEHHVIKYLGQMMTYFTWTEMSRVFSLCETLIHLGAIQCTQSSQHEIPIELSKDDSPALNVLLVMSNVLLQVFKTVSSPCCSSWATPDIYGHALKLYVTLIKEMCQELISDCTPDKNLVDDVISRVFVDLCHVVCEVPTEVTDSLFILALDLASMVSGRHVITLVKSVAMVPQSVYTESLLQKLEHRRSSSENPRDTFRNRPNMP